jgi:Ca2+-transporting ATPase
MSPTAAVSGPSAPIGAAEESSSTQAPATAAQAYARDVQAIAADLGVDPAQGLSGAEAASRLKRYGPNQLAEAVKASPLMLFLRQFANPLLIILLVGAAISGYTGHWVDAIAIVVIVLINATISFMQEIKAERSLAALSEMAAPLATVRRDGD